MVECLEVPLEGCDLGVGDVVHEHRRRRLDGGGERALRQPEGRNLQYGAGAQQRRVVEHLRDHVGIRDTEAEGHGLERFLRLDLVVHGAQRQRFGHGQREVRVGQRHRLYADTELDLEHGTGGGVLEFMGQSGVEEGEFGRGGSERLGDAVQRVAGAYCVGDGGTGELRGDVRERHRRLRRGHSPVGQQAGRLLDGSTRQSEAPVAEDVRGERFVRGERVVGLRRERGRSRGEACGVLGDPPLVERADLLVGRQVAPRRLR